MANKAPLILLLAAIVVMGVSSHRLLAAEVDHRLLLNQQKVSVERVERQRILAEIEEVHQLRERMLQEGKRSFEATPSDELRVCHS